MGRLFWKFFLALWLAQALTTAGVGIAIWALRPGPEGPPHIAPPGDGPPPHPDRPPDGVRPPADALASGAPPDRPPPDRPRPHRPRPPWLPPVLPLVAGGLVSALFAALLAWYFARPIRGLRNAFDALAAGDLAVRASPQMGRRNDELADLGIAFDAMAERLQRLVDGQRNLLHDVSHELRSPLARLQAAGDLLVQQPARANELAARIGEEIARIDRLVGELLVLARLDAKLDDAQADIADLADIARAVAADARFEDDGHAGRIVLAADLPVMVRGQRALLHRALENVVRNALKYGGANGEVRIAVTAQDGHAQVSVEDDGPGISETEREAIFEPFRRGRHAQPFDGHGLGLAIARRVARVHGGDVTATNRAPHGLRVMFTLPLHDITSP